MGLIAMSERDLQRIEILSKVMAGRMTTVTAAHVLDRWFEDRGPPCSVRKWSSLVGLGGAVGKTLQDRLVTISIRATGRPLLNAGYNLSH